MMQNATRALGSILLPALFAGCAGTPKVVTPPRSPGGSCSADAKRCAATTRAATAAALAADAALLELVPRAAQAAVVVRPALIASLLGTSLAPALRRELSVLFRARVGADLTTLTGLVAFFVGSGRQPKVALLARLPITARAGAPAAAVVERRRGIAIVSAGAARVTALVPQGLLFGELEAVRVGVDHLVARAAPAAGSRGGDLVARLRQIDAPGVGLLAVLGTAGAAAVAPQVAGYGIDAAALAYGPEQKLVLRLSGDPVRLDGVLALYAMGRQMGLAALEQILQQKRNSQDLIESVGAIVSYHQLRDLLQTIQPQKLGDGIVVQAELPAWASANAAVMSLGVGAAIAIPAFARYQRRSRTHEATAALRQLQDALLAYHAGTGPNDKGRRGKAAFRWPATTPWSPAKGCCTAPGQTPSCPVSPETFGHPSWRALGFAPTEPTAFQFRLTSGGRGRRAWVEIEAQADLECDGTLTSHRKRGWLAPDGTVVFGSAQEAKTSR